MALHRSTGALPRVGSGLLLLLLSGACSTAGMRQAGTQPGMTRETYASLLSAIRSDPAARAEFTNRCTEGRAAEPEASRELTARMLGVDPANIDRVFCERETAAMARGEISYEDFTALTAHRADAATAARVVRSLTAPASPATVAAADRLDAYARLLRETGRAERADEVAEQSGKLRAAEQAAREAQSAFAEGRSYTTNVYLGFAPDRVLLEYAGELRRLGRTGEAEEVEAAAEACKEAQGGSHHVDLDGEAADDWLGAGGPLHEVQAQHLASLGIGRHLQSQPEQGRFLRP